MATGTSGPATYACQAGCACVAHRVHVGPGASKAAFAFRRSRSHNMSGLTLRYPLSLVLNECRQCTPQRIDPSMRYVPREMATGAMTQSPGKDWPEVGPTSGTSNSSNHIRHDTEVVAMASFARCSLARVASSWVAW
jgi:hypothetical protein